MLRIVKVFILTAILFIASLPAQGCAVAMHSRYTMRYVMNQISRMEIEREGEDYEGRTGVGATGTVTNFWYDVNGNMGQDMSRGILETRYNRLNLPTDVYFRNGHRQTIAYDGFGQKRQVSYSQTDDPMLGAMMGVPGDSAYTLQGRRSYLGPHVFVNDSLEYSAFPGGYFTPKGIYYYITDWQGNNIAVFSSHGNCVQQTIYYPYGEPTIEPAGQRYLFGGKEREHAGGRNSTDFGPRSLTPSGSWSAADRMSESFYPLSPFSYCGGDPINRVDRNGMWSIKVSASENREKHPYAVFSVFDRSGNTIYKTVVKVKGQHRNRGVTDGDTPQGKYKLLEWREIDGNKYKTESYGNEPLLATEYEGGEGNNRNGMHIHEGGPQEPELRATKGCIRISKDDIIEFRNITDMLEKNDSNERMEYMEVIDDLENPVQYQNRNEIKNDCTLNGGVLPEFIVVSFKEWANEYETVY